MWLKTIIGTLLVVGLLEQCAAFKLGASKGVKYFGGIDDFFFNQDGNNGDISVNASQAVAMGFDIVSNITAWERIVGPSYVALSLNLTWSTLNITYEQAVAQLGSFSDTGKFVAMVGHQPFNLTLNTTMKDQKCQLDMQMQAPGLRPRIDTTRLGFVGQILDIISPLKNEIILQLGKSLEKSLPKVLLMLLRVIFFSFADLDLVCRQIQDSTPNNHPEPFFN